MFRCQATRPRRFVLVFRHVGGRISRQVGAGVMAKTNNPRSGSTGPEAEEGKAAPAKRKLSLRLMIVAVAGLVALCAVAGGGYYLLSGGRGKAEAAAAPDASLAKSVIFLDMPDVLVNLSSSAGASERTQYLKVKVTLELPSETIFSR